MCLFVKNDDMSDYRDNICPHDIPIFKILTYDYHISWPWKMFPRYETPYYEMPVRFNKVLESDLNMTMGDNISLVSEGFHSFANLGEAVSVAEGILYYYRYWGKNLLVASGRIPQGSKHYKGTTYTPGGENNTAICYASEYIVYDKIIRRI